VRAESERNRPELLRRFEAELKKVGGQFFAAADPQAACNYILNLAASCDARSAVGWRAEVVDEVGVAHALAAAGISFDLDAGEDSFIERAASAGIGISGVDYALADTGSLVVLAGEGRARSVSLLPPVHVALVKPEQVIAGLDDLFSLLSERGNPSSAIAFITGPSRTADIELTLVVGVHGPQQLHVVLLSR
jgi:L-lactate dehydrogenase complex protein LldG